RVTGCVAVERIKAYCRIVRAGCEAEEGISALGCVVPGVASVRWWRQLCLRRRRKGDSAQHERNEKKTPSRPRPVHRIHHEWSFCFHRVLFHFLVLTSGLLCFVHAGGLSRLARGQLCSVHYESL